MDDNQRITFSEARTLIRKKQTQSLLLVFTLVKICPEQHNRAVAVDSLYVSSHFNSVQSSGGAEINWPAGSGSVILNYGP
jgi:hypothetical protein